MGTWLSWLAKKGHIGSDSTYNKINKYYAGTCVLIDSIPNKLKEKVHNVVEVPGGILL